MQQFSLKDASGRLHLFKNLVKRENETPFLQELGRLWGVHKLQLLAVEASPSYCYFLYGTQKEANV